MSQLLFSDYSSASRGSKVYREREEEMADMQKIRFVSTEMEIT